MYHMRGFAVESSYFLISSFHADGEETSDSHAAELKADPSRERDLAVDNIRYCLETTCRVRWQEMGVFVPTNIPGTTMALGDGLHNPI